MTLKKKIIIIVSLAVAIAAVAVIGGSLAWFMDADEVKNVFEIGSIETVQHEQQYDENGDLGPFVNDKMLIPVIDNSDAINDDNFQDKIVTVENIGKNEAYIQTYVAVPAVLDNAGIVHIYDENHANNGWTLVTDVDTAVDGDQAKFEGVTIEGMLYNVYLYRYNGTLAPKAITKSVIQGVYIDMTADLDVVRDSNGDITEAYFVIDSQKVEGFNANEKLSVYVATQAIQAEGFDNAESAFASGFGTGASSLPDFSKVVAP